MSVIATERGFLLCPESNITHHASVLLHTQLYKQNNRQTLDYPMTSNQKNISVKLLCQ